MERLTYVDENGTVLFSPKGSKADEGFTITQLIEGGHLKLLNEIAEKLANYEQQLQRLERLREQGKLLQLPCAVGDTVYAYCGEFGVLPYEVDCIVIDENITYQCGSYSEPIGDCPSECLDEIEPDLSDFGKTVFLSREEAEKALEEKAE